MSARDPRGTAVAVCRTTAVLLMLLLVTTVVFAKATVVTLPELISQSELIVYGHFAAESGSTTSSATVPFEVVRIIKGSDSFATGSVVLCNPSTMLDRPDLSKMRGDGILFLVKKGQCLALSHSYRSLVPVKGNRASTVAIRGQPDEQALEAFLDEVKELTSK
ncbi:MAG: hypothetical protein ACLPTM_12445 [Steroidobacteraceae bacterium]